MLPEYQASLEQLLITKDSLYAVNSAEGIAELQTKYDVQKRKTQYCNRNTVFSGRISYYMRILFYQSHYY